MKVADEWNRSCIKRLGNINSPIASFMRRSFVVRRYGNEEEEQEVEIEGQVNLGIARF